MKHGKCKLWSARQTALHRQIFFSRHHNPHILTAHSNDLENSNWRPSNQSRSSDGCEARTLGIGVPRLRKLKRSEILARIFRQT